MWQVIAMDLDGTLFRSDGSISYRTIVCLEECVNTGSRLVVATARAPRFVAGYLPSLFSDCLWVCYNGAQVYMHGRLILNQSISPELAKNIVELVKVTDPSAIVSVEIDDRLYASRRLSKPWAHEVVDLRSSIKSPVAKILLFLEEEIAIDVLTQDFPYGCRCIRHHSGRLVEVVAKGVSKASGLKALLNEWSYGLDAMIAFGDDLSDMEMLAESGFGVAMGNAVHEVKAVADRVTASNDEDGIAQILEELL